MDMEPVDYLYFCKWLFLFVWSAECEYALRRGPFFFFLVYHITYYCKCLLSNVYSPLALDLSGFCCAD